MRTTIELSDHHRAQLLELAARKRKKGFSDLIAEAVDQYLLAAGERKGAVRQAMLQRGTLTEAEADDLTQSAADARASWRTGDAAIITDRRGAP